MEELVDWCNEKDNVYVFDNHIHIILIFLGIERRTQTAGESKDWSDPFKPQNEEDKAITQKLLNALHINFKNQVKNARGDKLKAPDSTLFNGHVWVGQEAVELGLVDGIDTMHRQRFVPSIGTIKKLP